MNENPVREGEPTPRLPSPPVPPPTPLPPIPLDTLWDVAKIVIFVLVWYITTDANKALVAYVDYGKLAAASSSLLGVSWQGAMVGLLQGMIMAVQGLAVIWASPTLFIYLGPVLTAAFKTPIKIVAEFRKALNPKTDNGDGDKPADSDKKT